MDESKEYDNYSDIDGVRTPYTAASFHEDIGDIIASPDVMDNDEIRKEMVRCLAQIKRMEDWTSKDDIYQFHRELELTSRCALLGRIIMLHVVENGHTVKSLGGDDNEH